MTSISRTKPHGLDATIETCKTCADIGATSARFILAADTRKTRWKMFRDELRQDEHQRTREICETRMRLLFEELPWLSGFFVDRDLGVAEISIYAWPGWSASPALREDLDRFLLDLVEEGPEVAQLLRNRTFARSLQ